MATPYSAQDTQFFISSSTVAVTTSTANLVGSVHGFNGPDGQSGEIDITSFDSTAKEFLLGLRDEGNFSIDFHSDPADPGQVILKDVRDGRIFSSMKLKLADASTTVLDFRGYVKNLTLSGSVDNVVDSNAVIRISGPVTWTTA